MSSHHAGTPLHFDALDCTMFSTALLHDNHQTQRDRHRQKVDKTSPKDRTPKVTKKRTVRNGKSQALQHSEFAIP